MKMLAMAGFVFLISTVTAMADAPTPYPSADDYPQMPYINRNPGPEYAGSTRKFQGIPSIAVAPGGRLWVTWYGGGEGESSDNYVLLATSGDDGKTWSGPKMVIDPPFRASEPALWLDPQNRLWFMWNLYPVRSSALERKQAQERFSTIDAYNAFIGKFSFVASQLWVMTTGNPDAENPVWSEPRLIAMETHNMNKPTVLADGTWLLARHTASVQPTVESAPAVFHRRGENVSVSRRDPAGAQRSVRFRISGGGAQGWFVVATQSHPLRDRGKFFLRRRKDMDPDGAVENHTGSQPVFYYAVEFREAPVGQARRRRPKRWPFAVDGVSIG